MGAEVVERYGRTRLRLARGLVAPKTITLEIATHVEAAEERDDITVAQVVA